MAELDRSKLPMRRQPFQGVAGRTLDGARPDWNLIGHPEPPQGSPNVLLVLIDDAGFGNASTFGGPIDTPHYTRIAEGGLRYNRFHVTALCSPTRAALLTGRNNHAVGFGSVGEFSSGFRGYTAMVPRGCTPLRRILKENGYSTAAFGKWHLTTDGQQGPAGPFERWPNGWGFEYFYGFLGGDSGQWDPCLAENEIIGTRTALTTRTTRITYPTRWLTRPSSGSTVFERRTPTSHSSSTSPPDAATPRTTWPPPGPTNTKADSTRVGPSSRGRLRPPKDTRGHSERCGTHRTRRRVSRLGRCSRTIEGLLRPPDGGLRRLLGKRRLQRRPGD